MHQAQRFASSRNRFYHEGRQAGNQVKDMNKPNYHPHIDGIRALAVLSVLLFHLELDFIPGGYTGVDMFFVISGFLITRLLYRDIQAGTFSFKRFYIRRIRRLAPALMAVLTGTFILGYLILTPSHFQRFSGALVSSVFSVSNVYFWAESGYFDSAAQLKPLLHTWSLSVEEQFYLAWPALIFFWRAHSSKGLLLIFVLLGLISLVAAKAMTPHLPEAAFYLMPPRVYEFAIGAILALLPAMAQLSNARKEILTLIGYSLIGYSVLAFNEFTPIPDLYALLPCLGAACLIAAGDARLSGRILVNPVSAYLGRISYSLYLVHWPIIVLYKHIRFTSMISERMAMLLLMLSLLTAHLLHVYIENRFRYPSEKKPTLKRQTICWAVPLLMCVVSVHVFNNNGWPHRFDAGALQAVGNLEDRRKERNDIKDHKDNLAHRAFDLKSDIRLLVVGDSHATDIFNALYVANPFPEKISVRLAYFDEHCYYLFDKNGKSEREANEQKLCRESYATIQKNPLIQQANWIVVSTRWDQSSLDYIDQFVEFLTSADNQVIISGRTAEFKNVPSLVYHEGLVSDITRRLAGARATWIDKLNLDVQAISESLGVYFLDKLPFLCSIAEQRCDVVDSGGLLLYTDYGHWSMEGASYFGARLWNEGPLLAWFNGENTHKHSECCDTN